MKNKLIELQIKSLVEEKERISYEMRNVGFNDMSWVTCENNFNKRINDIDFRIDNLLMQIIEP
jgi:hypothetical protein